MIKRPPSYSFHFKTRKRKISTCSAAAYLDIPPPTATLPNGHKTLCFSLAENLFRRGRLASAQEIIQRIVTDSSTVPDAISTVDFAASRGINLSVGIYAAFVRKLVDLGEPNFAYTVYCESINRSIQPNASITNSMIICFVKLGKLEEARLLFDKLIGNGCVPCNAACNVILRELCGQEMFLEAFDCFVRIRDAKMQLGMWFYNVLIDGLCSKGCVGDAMEVFNLMPKRTSFLPTLHNYKSLFYGLCKRGWVVEAESICGKMEARGFFVDKVMYTTLMNVYIKDKKMKMGVRIFLRMLKMGCYPDTVTYTALIQGIAKMGYFEKAWILYNQMNESRMLPDAVTYHVMISSYCNVGKVDCARMLLNNMAHCNLVPSVHTYTALIAALYRSNEVAEIDELYKSMLGHGVFPDHVLFLILMKNSRRGNELQLCFLMLQEIFKNCCGLEASLLSGSININPLMNLEQEIELLLEKIIRSNLNLAKVAFCIYITALCERGKAGAALACLRKMVDVGCIPSPFTFSSLIMCFCRNGHSDSIKSLIDIMQDWGIVPDSATYSVMVNEYCQQKDLKSAFLVLDQMEEKGLKPNVAIYDSIISCLSREKKMFEAETLFQRMLKAGVHPDETVYVTMINGYFRSGRILEAHQLFEKMIQYAFPPSLDSYTALISGLVKNNEIEKGCVYLDRMLRDGFVPNAVIYASLICHFLRKGHLEFAFRLFDLMDRSLIEIDLVMYIALVIGFCRNINGVKQKLCQVTGASERMRERLLQLLCQGNFLPKKNILRFSANSPEAMKFFAFKLMYKIKGTRFMPNLYLYNGIIAGFCWADRIKDAYIQFEKMQSEGLCPNEVTFTILIGAHCRAGEIDHAIELFNLMNANAYSPDKVTYSTLLKGLCKASREIDALSLFFTMHKRGFFPNKASYENLIRLFCARHLSIPAFKLFEEMLAHNYLPRQYTAEWLLHILHEEERLHESHIVLDMMHNRALDCFQNDNP
ncbi:pentatricopeptide repeat-containing protein At5g62370 isoform X2 [Ricinus communis]|uniref:pentatricopeptide repeat-containing protein At5g62370 isoform X2 n=1 Tax=Ricinus communis TaxID=3988 RepID=UPI00201A5024|nr:pentatricopeptide repeat-containing protein At5g62370 isoform X2 [Ricinus communis]XP_048235285.1 pentatricopeptide repeat-containing protein At5g62370 isoform X2 [Ricinus communis]